jgi:hypothetical protein
MLSIYLTDTEQHVQFNDYPSDQPVKFLLNLKRFSKVLVICCYLFCLKIIIWKMSLGNQRRKILKFQKIVGRLGCY